MLKSNIDAGSHSVEPECTSLVLSLAPEALLPLRRPNVGPFAEGGDRDLPAEFKTPWSNLGDGENGGGIPGPLPPRKKSHPQATVQQILSCHSDARSSVQRAASRGIVAAIEAVDGFRYSFNNTWNAKEDAGLRFSYICQDSLQSRDRHANDFSRTQEPEKAEKERGPTKATYDCKGTVGVKCSLNKWTLEVVYRHAAIHEQSWRSLARKMKPAVRRPRGDAHVLASKQNTTTGGLRGQLQAEYAASMELTDYRSRSPSGRNETSNVGKPLKRKRSEPSSYSRTLVEPLSLVDLLRQSEATKRPPVPLQVPSQITPPTNGVAITYDLPSLQTPTRPSPFTALERRPRAARPTQLPPLSYAPPYQPSQTPKPQSYIAERGRDQPNTT